MKELAPVNDFAKRAKEMNGSILNQNTNVDWGKKRKAKAHKYSVRDTNTGKLYWSPAIMEKLTLTKFLIQEKENQQTIEKLTTLPDVVVSELRKLIAKGAKDLAQNWKDAAELTNTAYHVAKIRRPIPDQRGAWAQYEDLLKYGVQQLWNTRGNDAPWRASAVIYTESSDLLTIAESKKADRFFVKIPGTMDVEVEADDMTDLIDKLSNKIRRHGGKVEVRHRTQEGAILIVWKKSEEVEEIIIRCVS